MAMRSAFTLSESEREQNNVDLEVLFDVNIKSIPLSDVKIRTFIYDGVLWLHFSFDLLIAATQ